MNIAEAIRAMLAYRKTSQALLAKKMGYTSQAIIATMLSRKNVNVETLVKMADALDFDIVLQPKGKMGKRPEGTILLDQAGKEKEDESK